MEKNRLDTLFEASTGSEAVCGHTFAESLRSCVEFLEPEKALAKYQTSALSAGASRVLRVLDFPCYWIPTESVICCALHNTHLCLFVQDLQVKIHTLFLRLFWILRLVLYIILSAQDTMPAPDFTPCGCLWWSLCCRSCLRRCWQRTCCAGVGQGRNPNCGGVCWSQMLHFQNISHVLSRFFQADSSLGQKVNCRGRGASAMLAAAVPCNRSSTVALYSVATSPACPWRCWCSHHIRIISESYPRTFSCSVQLWSWWSRHGLTVPVRSCLQVSQLDLTWVISQLECLRLQWRKWLKLRRNKLHQNDIYKYRYPQFSLEKQTDLFGRNFNGIHHSFLLLKRCAISKEASDEDKARSASWFGA